MNTHSSSAKMLVRDIKCLSLILTLVVGCIIFVTLLHSPKLSSSPLPQTGSPMCQIPLVNSIKCRAVPSCISDVKHTILNPVLLPNHQTYTQRPIDGFVICEIPLQVSS